MGTRGFTGVVIDGVEKISYNHYDSYPEGLGAKTLDEVRLMTTNLDHFRELARALVLVDDDAEPTAEHLAKFAEHANPDVGGSLDKPTNGTVQSYYQLLRNLQGNLLGQLEAGVAQDWSGFQFESLFCEWGYLVDFDKDVFQVYKGFQQGSPPQKGRWANRPLPEEIEADIAETAKTNESYAEMLRARLQAGDYYYAVELVAEWPLDALPDDPDFIFATNPPEEG